MQPDCPRFRWYLDLDAFSSSSSAAGVARLRALLPAQEQSHVTMFINAADQHRALASRVLQRCCVCLALGVEWSQVRLSLTKGRKPYTTNPKPPTAPNFNYNVSHEGRYVVLASDPLYLVGVDVAAPRTLRPGGVARPLEQHLANFRGQLADSEWELLQRLAADEPQREAAFQQLWSLKEAYVKARGDGLGFSPLSRAAFSLPSGWWGGSDGGSSSSAILVLDGAEQTRWRFHTEQLPQGHCVSVATGPAADAVDQLGGFTASLLQPQAAPDASTPCLAMRFEQVELGSLLARVGVEGY